MLYPGSVVPLAMFGGQVRSPYQTDQVSESSLWLSFDGSNDFVTWWTLYTVDCFTRDMSWPQTWTVAMTWQGGGSQVLESYSIDNWLLTKFALSQTPKTMQRLHNVMRKWLFQCTLLTIDFELILEIFLLIFTFLDLLVICLGHHLTVNCMVLP